MSEELNNPEKTKDNWKKTLLILLVSLLVIMLVGVGLYLMISRPSEENAIPNGITPSEEQPATSSNTSNPITGSGISVTIVCIVKISETPCVVGGIIVQTLGGQEVARKSANSSNFNLNLDPAEYLIVPLPGTKEYPVINFTPRNVKIETGHFKGLKLIYWSGSK